MLNRHAVILASLSLLAGCATLAPTVPPSAQADANSGYVAGLFSRDGMSFALVIRAADGAGEYIMPMGEDTRWPANLSNSTVAISIPPGTYAISHWFTYSTVSKETISRVPNTVPGLGKPFTVKTGAVTHLGKFLVESRRDRSVPPGTLRYHMRVHPVPASTREILDSFATAYPGLASQRVTCIACTDKLAGE